jgi:glutathione S-transferase
MRTDLPTPHEAQEKAAEAAGSDLTGCLEFLNQALDGKPFLVGDYSLADVHLSSMVGWLRMLKIDVTPYATLHAWSARCAQRPAFQKVMAGVPST